MPSKPKKKTNRSVGLDLDGSFIAAAEMDDDGRVTRAVSADLPPSVVQEGEVVDGPALTEALKAFFKEHALPRNVHLGVSSQQIVVRQLELPKIDKEDERAAAVRFQAAEAIAMPLEEAVLDFQLLEETVSPEGTPRQRFVVVAARESMIAALVAAVRDAKLKPEGIDLNAFALVRALRSQPGPDEQARVFCHLGALTNLAIASGGACLFTRPLATTLDHEGAEGTPAALAEEIRLSIDFYMGQPGAQWVGDILLSGPGSPREGLAESLSAEIGLPVSVAEAAGALAPGALGAAEDARRHTVAVGLAMGAAA